ncbi:hypothetical protein [Dactylosporangium sp. CS-033363]|uniref:hypothetical protein n=1 Tax=Dactylosporangium sp. CS-033363 TaxID=3239935 RepID=UPI003D8E333F
MSRTLHTDPYHLRAARRPHAVPIRMRPARPGFVHPASPADIAALLDTFGPAATYGLRRIELRHRTGPAVAELRVPGIILLFEQRIPPWHLTGRLQRSALLRLERAGAIVETGTATTRVHWPHETLRDFVLFDGLMHEVGHHTIQHAANKHRTPAMRTADHERRADAFAARARAAAAANAVTSADAVTAANAIASAGALVSASAVVSPAFMADACSAQAAVSEAEAATVSGPTVARW